MKKVRTPEGEERHEIHKIVYGHLLLATEFGAKEAKCTGFSFVTIAMGLWSSELADVHPKATSNFLHALGDLFDPDTSKNKKMAAEKKRSVAVRTLAQLVDLQMSKPEGTA